MSPAPPRQAAGVLLDMDGTLLDTAPDMATALNRLRAENGLPALPYPPIRAQVSHGSAAVVRLGFPLAGEREFDALRDRFLHFYREHLVEATRPFEGFEAVLQTLESHAIPWGVVTNTPAWLTEPLLAALGLRTRAGCVLSGDSLPQRKPDPRPLLVAADQLGVLPGRCLYLGDAERDIMAARGAGMIALGARFGYLGEADQPERWGADGWIATPAELLPWVGLSPAAVYAP